MNKQDIKQEAKSLVRNAKAYGYSIKHGHALEIISKMRGAGNYQTIAAMQPTVVKDVVCAASLPGNEPNQEMVIVVTSPDAGAAIFGYEDEDLRNEGLLGLMISTQERQKGAECNLYFSTIGVCFSPIKAGEDGGLVATWNGESWSFISDVVDLSGHDYFLCDECGKVFDNDDSCSHQDGLVCITCKADMNVSACDAGDLIGQLGLDRDDIAFWVSDEFEGDFESADNEAQEQWVHQYRQRFYGQK